MKLFLNYIIPVLLGVAVLFASPFILVLSIFKFYNFQKFTTDILFRKKLMRKLVYLVQQFETENFTSSLYKRANNVCGMGVPNDKSYWVGTIEPKAATDGLKSKYLFAWLSVYDLWLWFKFRAKCLDAFNVVASQTSGHPFNELIQLLPQYGFTTTNAVVYARGLKVYEDKYKATYFLSLGLLFSDIFLWAYVGKLLIKKLRTFKKK